jgi:hypothetical protein
MPRLETSIIMSREAQTSDTALFRKDLPKAGAYTALDIGIRMTNGSTSAQGVDPLDVIKKISLVLNGNDYRWHMSGHEFYRWQWMKRGRPMPYTFTQSANGVQEVWFRMEFGRFFGDNQLGLNLERFQNAQVQIDYDMTVPGAIAATTLTTGTFTVTIIAHQFPFSARPSFRGMMGCREFYTTTTLASGDIVQDLPASNQIAALSIMCIEDAIADAVDITDIEIGKDNFSTSWIKGKWYNFAVVQNQALDVREEIIKLFADDAQTVDMHVTNIKSAIAKCRAVTTAVA